MPKKKLTDLFVERAKPPARGRLEYVRCIVSWARTARHGKWWQRLVHCSTVSTRRLRRFTIGAYPAIKPAQARREAAAALDRPRVAASTQAVEKRTRRYARAPGSRHIRRPLVQDFGTVRPQEHRAGTFKETKRVLESEDLAEWRNRPSRRFHAAMRST